MQAQISKTLALLGGVATLALGSTFVLRLAPAKPKVTAGCMPRLVELERAVCEPPASVQPFRVASSAVH